MNILIVFFLFLVKHIIHSNSTIVPGTYYTGHDTTTPTTTTAIAAVPPVSGPSLAVHSLVGAASATVIIAGTIWGISRLIKWFNQVSLYY